MHEPIVKTRMSRKTMPARKVMATSLASALTVLVLWVLNTWIVSEPISAEVAGALATVILFVVPFVVGWSVPPSPHDGIETFVVDDQVAGPTP
ncbi:MAG: hypothetical protein AAGF27_01280 [Pseudomonadota bacterium]